MRMKKTSFLPVIIISLFQLAHAQTAPQNQTQTINVGIKDQPCDFINREQASFQDFGNLCKYEKLNTALPDPTLERVGWFGDSITEGWGSGIIGLNPQDTINRGISGQTTPQMRLRFRADVINLKARILHIMAGTNDIAGNTGPTSFERMKDNFRSMCEEAAQNNIKVVIGSILPARAFSWRPGIESAEIIRKFNSWLKSYADSRNFIFVDYHSAMTESDGGLPSIYSIDGVHPTPAGYAVMAKLAREAISKAAGQ
jgi:lysophospholipase L1-like esterase